MLKVLVTVWIALIYLPNTSGAQFFAQGQFIKDVENRVLWLRCTVGQVWSPETKTCTGKIVKLNQEEIEAAIIQAEEQLPGAWRLPTLSELESLVCNVCTPAKVQNKYFPGIAREAYWSGTRNTFNRRMFWSVNFQTGHRYSRFLEFQQLPFLLVQDY